MTIRIRAIITLAALLPSPLHSQAPTPSPGVRYDRLLIKNALVIDGAGNPLRGPYDILVEGSRIARMARARPVDESGRAAPSAMEQDVDRVIDATGMYVMPGIVDMHGHIQFSRAGEPMPKDYVYKLWLAHGITTIRDPGSGEGIDTVVHHQKLSEQNLIAAPTIVPYATVRGADNAEQAREEVRRLRERGARGLKVFVVQPDIFDALTQEARRLGLPVAVDLKIQEVDAMQAAQAGVRTIEHWYGIPDAAIPGPQNFPDYYNYSNELDRFRWAGDLWRQADPELLSQVIDSMLAHDVTWDPTFAVYEANRDVSRARNLPWFDEYALPNVLRFFEPDPTFHGSYHFDWTTADEVMWRDNYRIWMHWVREFARRGGNVTVGSDAGFIYHLYGFATVREMEMHQEAGFHPIEVIQHATSNGALALGLTETGVIRPGFEADIAIVDGNPLHNMKLLYGMGIEVVSEDGQVVRRGGVRYTIKDGIVFDAPALLAEVREAVRVAKEGVTAP